MPSQDFINDFVEHGYAIIPDLIPPALLPELLAASKRVVDKTRSGAWSHRRVVGRQFPPFDSDNPDSWGVQHLMHPDLGEPAFAKWYASDGLVSAVLDLLGCREDELQMGESSSERLRCFFNNLISWTTELFNLLINPTNHDFALRWHRDDVRENAPEEEERSALGIWHHGVGRSLKFLSTTNPCILGTMEHVS